ncbi:MAG: flippase-like domain-containing protein [Deltaproteobacteria bacterium]|nr:flippase-like domain-containing protein [Deltaproteobacteria bacterium]
MSAAKKLINPLFFVAGLVLLSFLIRKFGYMELVRTFRDLGWDLIYVLVIPFSWYSLHTLGWYLALEETGRHINFWSLLKIKLGGESVNTLTPVSFMGGDPVRILLLKKRMPGTLSTASVVLDRTMQSLGTVILLTIGMFCAWVALDLPSAWKILFPVITGGIGGLTWFFIHRQKKGIFDFLTRAVSRFGFRKLRAEKFLKPIEEIDGRISHFYHHNPRRFYTVLACHLTGRLCGVAEIYLVAHFMSIPLPLLGALYLATLTVLVNIVFVFIPGSMGVMEGAYGILLHLLGLNPIAGVAIQLVRRLRTIVWIFIGLSLMFLYNRLSNRTVAGTAGPAGAV